MLKKFEGEKRKQYIALGVAVALLGGGMFLLSEIFGKKKEEKREGPPVKVEAPSPKKTEEETLRALYGEKITQLEKRIEELERRNNQQQQKGQSPPSIAELLGQGQKEPSAFPPPPPPPPPPPSSPPPATSQGAGQSGQQGEAKKPEPQVLADLIVIKKGEESPATKKEEKKEEIKPAPQVPQSQSKKSLIPAGAFVKAVLLSGLDAPTGGKAQSSPHPVLIRIVDKAVLPNLWKADIKDCFVIGSGYGDLPSERAYIRLEVLSCVKKDGTVVEKKVKGYVAGEDGKVGLLGRVVSKQGAILARMLLAGFIDGISRVFQQSGSTVIVSPQGSLTTIDPGKALNVGIAGGFTFAAKELVEQYKKLADETYPVVEINAGRKVDVVFLQSIDFSSVEQEQAGKQENKQEGNK